MRTEITVKIIHSKDEIENAAKEYQNQWYEDNNHADASYLDEAFKAGVDWVLRKLEEDNN